MDVCVVCEGCVFVGAGTEHKVLWVESLLNWCPWFCWGIWWGMWPDPRKSMHHHLNKDDVCLRTEARVLSEVFPQQLWRKEDWSLEMLGDGGERPWKMMIHWASEESKLEPVYWVKPLNMHPTSPVFVLLVYSVPWANPLVCLFVELGFLVLGNYQDKSRQALLNTATPDSESFCKAELDVIPRACPVLPPAAWKSCPQL